MNDNSEPQSDLTGPYQEGEPEEWRNLTDEELARCRSRFVDTDWHYIDFGRPVSPSKTEKSEEDEVAIDHDIPDPYAE